MALCHKCGKPVYFAERTVALGKEWHRNCFKCTECSKVLQPGRHTEHKGFPYCEIPCYSALFGLNATRRVSQSETHAPTNYPPAMNSPVKRHDLEKKLASFNDYSEKQLVAAEVNGLLVIEGSLRIHWGIRQPIRFKQKDDAPPPSYRHSSYCRPESTADEANVTQVEPDWVEELQRQWRASNSAPTTNGDSQRAEPNRDSVTMTTTTHSNGVVMRADRRKQRKKRLSIINGHIYNTETSMFVPPYGTVTNVNVSSLDSVPQVIRVLLDKFKVENTPEEFCLCIVKNNGVCYALQERVSPLVERVLLGPIEDDAKIFFMERCHVFDISHEVAQYINLPEAVLIGFLAKYKVDEENELEMIKEKHKVYRERLQERLSEFESYA